VSAGTPVDRNDIDLAIGTLAAAWNDNMHRIKQLQAALDQRTAADLMALGYSTDEAGLIKSAIAALGKSVDVTRGQLVKNDTEDLTVFSSRVWGLGITRLTG